MKKLQINTKLKLGLRLQIAFCLIIGIILFIFTYLIMDKVSESQKTFLYYSEIAHNMKENILEVQQHLYYMSEVLNKKYTEATYNSLDLINKFIIVFVIIIISAFTLMFFFSIRLTLIIIKFVKKHPIVVSTMDRYFNYALALLHQGLINKIQNTGDCPPDFLFTAFSYF